MHSSKFRKVIFAFGILAVCISTGMFAIGTVVDVQSRTWPGINKQGGTGFVKSCDVNEDGENVYTVAYVLGGKEDGILEKYITIAASENAQEPWRRKTIEILTYSESPEKSTEPKKRVRPIKDDEKEKLLVPVVAAPTVTSIIVPDSPVRESTFAVVQVSDSFGEYLLAFVHALRNLGGIDVDESKLIEEIQKHTGASPEKFEKAVQHLESNNNLMCEGTQGSRKFYEI